MNTRRYLVARLKREGYIGTDERTFKPILVGVFDRQLVRYQLVDDVVQDTASLNTLVFGDVHRLCEYSELSPTSFTIEILSITSEPVNLEIPIYGEQED